MPDPTRRSFLLGVAAGAAALPHSASQAERRADSGRRRVPSAPAAPRRRVLLGAGAGSLLVSGGAGSDERGQPVPVAPRSGGEGGGADSRHRPGLLVQQPGQVRCAAGGVACPSRGAAGRRPRRGRAGAQHERGQQHCRRGHSPLAGRRGRPLGPEPPDEQRGVGRAGCALRLLGQARVRSGAAVRPGRAGRPVPGRAVGPHPECCRSPTCPTSAESACRCASWRRRPGPGASTSTWTAHKRGAPWT